jgi:hypothetical protein
MECVLERLRVWWRHILAIKTFSARLIDNGEALILKNMHTNIT